MTVPPASFRVEPADGVTGSGGDVRVRRTVGAVDATLADLGFAVSRARSAASGAVGCAEGPCG